MQQQTPPEPLDLAGMVADLNSLLRLKTTVIGIKMFARVEEMAAIPKIRRPSAVHTTDQIVSMASRLGWTVGITGADLVGSQCRAVIGLAPQDEEWRRGEKYVGIWHGTQPDAQARQVAGFVATGWLNFDDLGPQIGQDHAAGGAHHHVGEFEHANAVQGQVFFG